MPPVFSVRTIGFFTYQLGPTLLWRLNFSQLLASYLNHQLRALAIQSIQSSMQMFISISPTTYICIILYYAPYINQGLDVDSDHRIIVIYKLWAMLNI